MRGRRLRPEEYWGQYQLRKRGQLIFRKQLLDQAVVHGLLKHHGGLLHPPPERRRHQQGCQNGVPQGLHREVTEQRGFEPRNCDLLPSSS